MTTVSGVGFDLVDLADFARTLQRSGDRFLNRIYTEAEIEYCRSQPHPSQHFAVRFAAKEAAMKALGLAGDEQISWREFEVVRKQSGAPELVLHGEALEKCRDQRLRWLHLSLSHSLGAAGAVVIAESEQSNRSKRKRSPAAGARRHVEP